MFSAVMKPDLVDVAACRRTPYQQAERIRTMCCFSLPPPAGSEDPRHSGFRKNPFLTRKFDHVMVVQRCLASRVLPFTTGKLGLYVVDVKPWADA